MRIIHPVFYCETNLGHEHSTAWEAENCSRLYEALSDAIYQRQRCECNWCEGNGDLDGFEDVASAFKTR